MDELRKALTLTSLNSDSQVIYLLRSIFFDEIFYFSLRNGNFSQGWEERTYANVIHLLKTDLSNSDKDELLVPPDANKNIADFNQFWKLLCTAFDRVTNGKFSLSLKLEQNRST